MGLSDTKKLLWDNIAALMQAQWKEENITRLARNAKVGPATVDRMKAHKTSIGLDILVKIAKVFGREPWQLLHPNREAVLLSPKAAEIGQKYDLLPEVQQPKAYALMVQIVEFGNTGPVSLSEKPRPDPDDGPGRRPGEDPTSPAPTSAPEKAPKARAG